jgi:signal transduction histidine kinase
VRSDARATAAEFYRKNDLVSYAGVPMIAANEIIGVLGFYTKEEHDFEPEEINFLETLAGQAAIALQNSQLYEQARVREAQLEASNRMLAALHAAAAAASQSLDLERVLRSVIEKITEIFHFRTTQIHIHDPARDELVLGGYFDAEHAAAVSVRSFRMGEGIVGRVAETGKAVVFEDIATDELYRTLSRSGRSDELGHRFFAVFPIRGKRKNHGTLAFTAIQPRRLSPDETKLIEALTDQLAIAIENSKLYDELKQKVGELQRANKVKDEFLSVMSHELRTPLNIVIGYAGLIREGMLGPTNIEQDKALDKLVTRTHELLSMITGILYATSIEANEVRVDEIAFALGGLLDEIKRAHAAPLSKPIHIDWHYGADLPVVRSDPDKIRWILQALLENAIKFTENGSVVLTTRVVNEWMEFQVSDTGIGISEEKLALIFDKFRQADGSETRRYGGIGLGLYIARSFTRLLGGTIEIDSKPERGSTFTVKLPCRRV